MFKNQSDRPDGLRMTALSVAVAALVVGAALTTGCAGGDSEPEIRVIETQYLSAERKRELIDEARHRLDVADQRLNELEHQLEIGTPEERTVIEVRVKSLRAERDTLNEKFERLGNAAEDAWDEIWREVEIALDRLDVELNVRK